MEKNKPLDRQRKIIYKFNNKRLLNIAFLIIFVVIIFSLALMRFESNKLNIEIGDYASSDIRATRNIVDEIGTENLKQNVLASTQAKYRISPSIQIDVKDSISKLFDLVRDYKVQTNITNIRKAEEIQENLNFEISNDDIINMLRMEYQSLSSFETILIDLSNQIMGAGIKEEELEYEKENLSTTFDSLNLSDTQRNIGLAILTELIKANEFIDELETNRIRENVINSIEDIIIQENEIIVVEGELIDEHKYELIKESGLLKDSNESDLVAKIGIGILAIIGILTFVGYIYFFNYDIINNNRFLVLIISMLLTIFLSLVLYAISPFIIPVSIGGLLISILISSTLGIITNIFLALLLGIMLGLDLSFIVMLIIGGTIAILAITYQKQRSNILIGGIIMSSINILLITSFGLIKGLGWSDILIRDLQVFVNGIITTIIVIGSLPLWENLFSILTPIRLLELSNPNQPLLKRLLVEAPGTYHHSLMVGNLSEAAADKIGADSLLVRVGAYYHDIGKLYKPYYFKENQFSMSNPHDLLSPDESARIILGHVTEGLKMAKEYKLPSELCDFIDEHHGTTIVAYFYYKANEDDSSVNIENYRYYGKKPQSKETALVMLADSVEAAVRSIKEPTNESIEEMVTKVVKGKINDSQLDECDITNKDINIIIKTFINILIGIYHDRVEYPNMETIKEEG